MPSNKAALTGAIAVKGYFLLPLMEVSHG